MAGRTGAPIGLPLTRTDERFIMNKRFSLLAAPALVLASQVQAAVPADVTTAISDMKADGLTVATAVLVAVIAIAAVKFIRKGL
jgi:hypothetical protein